MRSKRKNFFGIGIGAERVTTMSDDRQYIWPEVAIKIFFWHWIWNYFVRIGKKTQFLPYAKESALIRRSSRVRFNGKCLVLR